MISGTLAKTLKRKIALFFFFFNEFLLSLKIVTFQTTLVRLKKNDLSAVVLQSGLCHHGD